MAVTAALAGRMKQPQPPSNALELSVVVTEHCANRGYGVLGPQTDKHGYLNFQISIPGRAVTADISFNGEVFQLTLPGGYGWTEFAEFPDDKFDAVRDLLAFLDAYADPATRELEVRRRLGRPRMELHVSNGAVLRKRGWSSGPPDVPSD